MENNKTISVIVPCYNEEETIPLFFEAMQAIQEQCWPDFQFDYIFVNDGSSDSSLEVLRQLHQVYPQVGYLSFSRNFGKEAALYAGLREAKGEWVTVMDVDLQDPPELLLKMIAKLTEDPSLDSVGCRRITREGEPPIRSFFANAFYRLINHISNVKMVDGARDFRLMRRQMVDAILEVTEYNRFSKGIFSWVGFKTEYLTYKNVERVAGKTSWNFWSLFRYSLEGIVNFSEIPLSLASYAGILFCLLAFGLAVVIVIRTLLFGDAVQGWTSMIAIILLLGGIQLLCLGILGKYLGKVFMETKKRPLYLIKERSDR
ncbi:glycosyltransferase family 2 protein [Streptococcus ovuberis]|uniref:Glycosyltransferase family 2 protein n=1 Tax=Streptococcus ovuberis TaxID=1936207 RepID=A0A7X6S0V2_9STRE|nr:glycosyltransferase family 2 protein [Streptococcus ovuberis]NKZ20494.1 glycosyltransferase family 2 protein [Streptococcus ovuberis]